MDLIISGEDHYPNEILALKAEDFNVGVYKNNGILLPVKNMNGNLLFALQVLTYPNKAKQKKALNLGPMSILKLKYFAYFFGIKTEIMVN